MLRQFVVLPQVFAVQQGLSEVGHLFFQPSGQDRQTHDLDQADVLFFDMVQFLVRMVEAHRMLWCGQVVPQDQIQFVLAVSHTRNRRNRVVQLAVCLGKNHGFGVRIFAPLGKNFSGQLTELVFVFRVQAKHRHRILHDIAVHILETRNIE